ncbi:MAG: LppX_LprAFG lipoprotein [Actinobacteria bacterium]|nr:LppX_LprAFG lipoprotein [Actinomycetota bacterium]
MRRRSLFLIITMLLVVALAAVGCGTASNVIPAAADDSPEAILAAAVAGAQDLTAASGSFSVAMMYDFDATKVPEEARAYVEEPMTVAGTFTSGTEPLQADLDLALTMGGETMNVGVKIVGDRGWIRMLDQWYEAPLETMSEPTFDQAQIAEMIRLTKELGVDPIAWFEDLTLVGEETVEGVATYHLSGTPDLARVLADVIGLMESEEFMELIDPDGAVTGSLEDGMFAIGADELQEVQNQITSMLKDPKVDIWVTKDGGILRKVDVVAHFTPPAGDDYDGLNAIDLKLGLLITGINQPVSVEPPASALPSEALEKALADNPEMFLGPLMGLYDMDLDDVGY